MKTLHSVWTLVLALGVLSACQSKESTSLMNLSPQEFSTQMKALGDSALLVDVRTPGEFQSGHIPGALLLDYQGQNFAAEVAKLPKDKKVFVYCRSGRRSKASAETFLNAGFQEVRNLADGILGWQDAALPVTRE